MWDILHSMLCEHRVCVCACCYCCFQLIPNILMDFRLGRIRKFPIHNKLNVNLCYLRLMLNSKGLQGALGNLNGACYSIHIRLNSTSSIKCVRKALAQWESAEKFVFIFNIISNLRFLCVWVCLRVLLIFDFCTHWCLPLSVCVCHCWIFCWFLEFQFVVIRCQIECLLIILCMVAIYAIWHSKHYLCAYGLITSVRLFARAHKQI